MEFAIIIKLILVGIMIFSGLSYLFQRSDNKQNLKQAIEHNEPIRQLTEEEYQLLKPYLDDKTLVKPYKYQSSLVSRDVSVITGSCVRHSLTTNGAESSYYFLIGNIEVFFPYSMESYTTTENVAEVVFTERYAFVVSLNGFSLMDAKADRDAESVRNEQWSQGSRGQFKTVTDEEINHISQQEHDAELDTLIQQAKNRRCEILEQRDETPFETARKNKLNTGFLTVLFGIIAAIFALCYEDSDDLWLLVVSGVCFIIAVIFYFHKPKRVIQKVNRVRGTIEAKNTDSHNLLVGDSLSLTYPKHWQAVLPEKTSAEADMDATVDAKELIRYGHSLSINKEIEQFGPAKFWGRNCFIFIVGTALSLFMFLVSTSLNDDALFTYRWITHQTTSWQINDESTLKQSTIERGDWVELNLNGASCDTTLYSESCNKVIINNHTIDLTNIISAYPQWATKLYNNTLVLTQRDAQVETLEMYEKLYKNLSGNNNNSYYNNYYNQNKKTYTKLLNINQLVLATDDACKTENSDCNRLKEIFTALLTDKDGNEFASWQEVVDYANATTQTDALIYITLGHQIESLFKSIADNLYSANEKKLIDTLAQLQNSENSLIIYLTNDSYSRVKLIGNYSPYSYDSFSRILYYSEILSFATGKVEIQGLVNDINYRDDGTLKSLSVNSDDRYKFADSESIPVATINIFIFATIMLITLLQGLIWLYKLRFNQRRLTRILDEYRNLIL